MEVVCHSTEWQHRGIRRVIKLQQRRHTGNRWNGSNNGNRETAVNQSVWGGWVVGRRCESLFCEAKTTATFLFSLFLGETLSEDHQQTKGVVSCLGSPAAPGWEGEPKSLIMFPLEMKTSSTREGNNMKFILKEPIALKTELASPHCFLPAL